MVPILNASLVQMATRKSSTKRMDFFCYRLIGKKKNCKSNILDS